MQNIIKIKKKKEDKNNEILKKITKASCFK